MIDSGVRSTKASRAVGIFNGLGIRIVYRFAPLVQLLGVLCVKWTCWVDHKQRKQKDGEKPEDQFVHNRRLRPLRYVPEQ